jgi:cytochrome c biogenesis protein CcmG, thiol:disulfide interchange protein DsbE
MPISQGSACFFCDAFRAETRKQQTMCPFTYTAATTGTIIENHRPKINTMKFLTLLLFITFSYHTFGQVAKVPSIQLKDLNGKTIDTGTLSNDGKPILICFWATWCSPCKKELNVYLDLYEEWQKETGVKIIAVSVDDQRSVSRVGPYVNSVSWEYDILLDTNKQFMQAMGVLNVPHTFLIDGKGNIVWQHNNFADGDEEEVHAQLLKLMGK